MHCKVLAVVAFPHNRWEEGGEELAAAGERVERRDFVESAEPRTASSTDRTPALRRSRGEIWLVGMLIEVTRNRASWRTPLLVRYSSSPLSARQHFEKPEKEEKSSFYK